MKKKLMIGVPLSVMSVIIIIGLLERVHIKGLCGFLSLILAIIRQNFAGILAYGKEFERN